MTDDDSHVAVIGLSGRFPGAPDALTFWQNLVDGRDTITRSDRRPAPGPEANGEYTPARGLLRDPEWFDAGYFGYSPRDATLISPQQRVFLECASEAIEDAGHDPTRHAGAIGVYAGGTETGYEHTLRSTRSTLPMVTDWEILLGSAPDYLASRAAYKLGLRGPAVTVQAACATSLVAVHTAIQALLAGDCDLALAGGAAVRGADKDSPYSPGGIISRDGVCRTFDSAADGTVGSDGAGVVVLRRLAEARSDGDHIYAVIRGSALGNDGPDRVGYTAPGVSGQARVISRALAAAGVDAGTIGYVEAHGTATPLGDPIEVAALTRAFRQDTDRSQFCLIGSVKTNIGHADAAAGAAGLIKTALALKHGLIPPSLHFTEPNPHIGFDQTPFHVATRLQEWPRGAAPRRAGVSSFGIGGTNAHLVLEEPPALAATDVADRPRQLLVLSAKTPAALDSARERLAAHLRAHPELPLRDVAWTLQAGRREHAHRGYAVAYGTEDAVEALTSERFIASAAPADSGDSRDGTDSQLLQDLDATGRSWLAGAPVSWPDLHHGRPRRVPLPGYPFQRQRYLVEPPGPAAGESGPGPGPAPGEGTLATVARQFSDILSVPEVGPGDSFFDLGGDSVVAASLAARLGEMLAVELDVLDVVDAETPAGLSALIDRRKVGEA